MKISKLQLIIKLFSLILIAATVFSCTKQSEDGQIPNYYINPENAEILLMSDYFDKLRYQRLDLDVENPIGSIKQLISYNDHYFILDNITNKVFKYSSEGTLKLVIDMRGQGPGEYQEISSISIAEADSLLVVYDKPGMAIRYYSTIDGSFKKDTYLNFLPLSITYIGDGKIAAMMNFQACPEEAKDESPNNLIYFRNPNRLTNTYLAFDPDLIYPNFKTTVFTGSNKKTFFMPTFYNEVFILDSNSCISLLKLDFEKYNFTHNIFRDGNSSAERLSNLYKSDIVFGKSNFHEFLNSYFFNFSWKGVSHFAFLEKTNNHSSIYKAIKNDINAYPTGTYVTSFNNDMYFSIEPHSFIETRNYYYSESRNTSLTSDERKKFFNSYTKLDSIFGSFSDMENPIVGIYNLK